MVAAEQLLAIALVRIRQPSLRVHLHNEYTARIGAVYHPQNAVLIIEYMRINDVGMNGCVINSTIRACTVPHARFQNNSLVRIRSFYFVGNSVAKHRAGRVPFAHAVIHIILAVWKLNNIACPEGFRLRPPELLGHSGQHIGDNRIAVIDPCIQLLP
ncbi:hypothetical protein D3C78_1068160 [compost metagenome]